MAGALIANSPSLFFGEFPGEFIGEFFGDFCQGAGGTAEQFIGYGCRLISLGHLGTGQRLAFEKRLGDRLDVAPPTIDPLLCLGLGVAPVKLCSVAVAEFIVNQACDRVEVPATIERDARRIAAAPARVRGKRLCA